MVKTIKDIAFTFEATAKDIVKVSNAKTEVSTITNSGRILETKPNLIPDLPPVTTVKKERFVPVERIDDTAGEEGEESTPTYEKQVQEIIATESIESNSLRDYVLGLVNETFSDEEYTVILSRVMHYTIKNHIGETSSSNVLPNFIFSYSEVNENIKLNNALRDHLLIPQFNYGVNDGAGFRTFREAVDTYKRILNKMDATTTFNTELFADISKILFTSQGLISNLSNNRVPLTYSFLKTNNNDNVIFDDIRDVVLLKSLNNSFPELSHFEKASFIDIFTRGVLQSIHKDHQENIEKLRSQFVDDLGKAGLSLVDITQFDFSGVNWSELFNDPQSVLYSLSDSTKIGISNYFNGIKNSFSELFTTTSTLLESLTFDIYQYPDDYLIEEEICKWINLAGGTTFSDYEDTRLLYFVKILSEFYNSAREHSEKIPLDKLFDKTEAFEDDAETLRDNYYKLLDTLCTDSELAEYRDHYKGLMYLSELEENS